MAKDRRCAGCGDTLEASDGRRRLCDACALARRRASDAARAARRRQKLREGVDVRAPPAAS